MYGQTQKVAEHRHKHPPKRSAACGKNSRGIAVPCGERVHSREAGQRGLVDGALAAAAHHQVRVAVLDEAVRVPDRVSSSTREREAEQASRGIGN